MGSFNNIIVSERNQRPSFDSRTILRSYFMRDGGYIEMDSSALVMDVHLFKMAQNTSPSSVLDATTGLVTDSAAAEAVWRWDLSGGGALLFQNQFDPTTSISCSSVYTVGDGQLATILNGVNDVSSTLRDGTVIAASSVLSSQPAGRYIDVWTVKLCEACDWQTFINETEFFQGNAVTLTEPLLFSTKERLYNKKIKLGSVENLKIGTEIIINNKSISDSMKNTLKSGLITSGSMQIVKHNDVDQTLAPRYNFKEFFQTEGSVSVTSDNTFVYKLDTNTLVGIDAMGTAVGTYTVQLKYNILDETILSPLMYFTVV